MAERALATAFVNIVPGTKDLESYLKGKLSTDVNDAGDAAGKTFGSKFSGGFKGVMVGLGGVVAALGIGNFVNDMVASAQEGQKADAVLSNITKSMSLFGDSTDTVITRLQDFATKQMEMTGIDDDVIKGAQAKLMTFSAVASSANEMGGAFDQATVLAMDLSAAGFGSMDSASVMLGKALQDPVAGVSALQRVGVALSETQKQQIDDFMAVGDVASAQNVILGEVERQVGGTAEASATASEKMKAKWDDLIQGIGTKLLPTFDAISNYISNTVIPAVEDFVAGVQGAVDWVQANANWFMPLVLGLGLIALGITGVAIAMQVQAVGGLAAYVASMFPAIASTWAFTAALLANPITWIVIGIMALIAAIILLVVNWDTVVAWISDVWDGFISWITDVIDGFVAWWNGLWDGVVQGWQALWSGISQFVSDVWNNIVAFFQGILDFVVNLFLNWTVFGIIISHWDEISKFIQDTWNNIVSFFQTIGKVLGDWWNGFWNGLIGFFKGVFTGVADFIGGIFKGVANAVIDYMNFVIGMVNTLIDGINLVLDGVSAVSGGTINLQVSHLGTIPHLAKGGLVTGPTTALIGEAGPEVVTPLKDFERMMGSNGNGQTVIYNAAPNQSIDSEQALSVALKRAKVLAAW